MASQSCTPLAHVGAGLTTQWPPPSLNHQRPRQPQRGTQYSTLEWAPSFFSMVALGMQTEFWFGRYTVFAHLSKDHTHLSFLPNERFLKRTTSTIARTIFSSCPQTPDFYPSEVCKLRAVFHSRGSILQSWCKLCDPFKLPGSISISLKWRSGRKDKGRELDLSTSPIGKKKQCGISWRRKASLSLLYYPVESSPTRPSASEKRQGGGEGGVPLISASETAGSSLSAKESLLTQYEIFFWQKDAFIIIIATLLL